jgi:hypothetical protein
VVVLDCHVEIVQELLLEINGKKMKPELEIKSNDYFLSRREVNWEKYSSFEQS